MRNRQDKMEEDEQRHGSPESLPALEDRTNIPMTRNLGHEQPGYQGQGERLQVYHDERTLHLEQHVHHPEPQVIGQLVASAASSEVRREAAEVISGVLQGANQAVAEAQQRATEIRREATEAVSGVAQQATNAVAAAQQQATQEVANARVESMQAQMRTESIARAQVTALTAEIQQLKAQLQEANVLNQQLRERNQTGLPVFLPHDNETTNATTLAHLDIRLKLERLEAKMYMRQEYIQELWMHQAPVPAVHEEEVKSPVVRMNQGDHDEGFELFGDARSSMSDSNDVERQCLRTKDLHHLKLPTLPETASSFRTWRNAVRTAILSYDLSPEGRLTPCV